MKKTKILSLLTASAMILGAVPAFAEPTPVAEESINFNDVEIDKGKTGFVSTPGYLRIGNDPNKPSSEGNAKLYKLNNAFGMDEDEYGVEMIAREQRQYKPFMLIGEYGREYSIENDFYIQANMYIGEAREHDYFRLGGEYNDGDTRNTQYVWFQGNGRIQDTNRNADERYGGAYLPNNWYNVTIGYDNETKKTSLYIDGKIFDTNFAGTAVNPKTVNTGIKNLSLGVRFEQRGTSDNGGLPSWMIMQDMSIVPESYIPENSDTSILSEVYETKSDSLFIQSSAAADKAQAYVSNVPDNVTVGEFLANISVPDGAEKKVVRIDEYSKATINIDESELIAEDMQLLVRAADRSKKLYDIRVTISEENLPKIISSEYEISGNTISVTPKTSVSMLINGIKASEGTNLKVVGINGAEITDGLLTSDMKLVASKGTNSIEYLIDVKDVYVLNTAAALASAANDEALFTATLPVAETKPIGLLSYIIYNKAGSNERLYGLGTGGSMAYYGTEEKGYSVTKSVPSQQKWTQKSFKKRNESYSFFCFRKTAAFIPRFA